MNKITPLLIASITILANGFVLMPTQASWEDSLQNQEFNNLRDYPSPLTHSEKSESRVENIESAKQNRPSNNNTPSSNNTPSNNNTYVFQTRSQINTELSVNSGDRISIRASGRIRFGFFAGSGGPRGILFNPRYNYIIDLPHGQLMGRVRTFGMSDIDGWFSVAEGRDIVVETPGVLEFAVNDNNPGDNAGAFRIEVAINPAQTQPENVSQAQPNPTPQPRNPAQSQTSIVVNNPRPSQCNLVSGNGRVLSQCREFRMLRVIDSTSNLDVFSLEFKFEDTTTIFAARSQPIQTVVRNGKTFGNYPIIGLIRKQSGQESTEDLFERFLGAGDRRSCSIASDYSELSCPFSQGSSIVYSR